jgi:hypothetical protein
VAVRSRGRYAVPGEPDRRVSQLSLDLVQRAEKLNHHARRWQGYDAQVGSLAMIAVGLCYVIERTD